MKTFILAAALFGALLATTYLDHLDACAAPALGIAD
jgi:hypothetical protein